METKPMKVCLFSPYIPKHFGGGERYLFDVALSFAKKHSVSISIPANHQTQLTSIRKKYEQFLGEDLLKIKFVVGPLGSNASFLEKLLWTRNWDVLYYLTDGSLFFSLAKKNILHIQFPLRINKRSPLSQLKLKNWQIKNTNSGFTKSIIEPSWPVKIDLVHHPLIETKLKADKLAEVIEKKEKIILHVGRFFKQMHSKKQEVLVSFFKNLLAQYPQQVKGWQLVLIGSVEDSSYAKDIHKLAAGLPIRILHAVDRKTLSSWYQRAQIYWHATGFGIDQAQHPLKVEHFGITTVEAMSYGCAPIVINKGGQPEILGSKLTSLLWSTEKECLATTIKLITDSKQRTKMQSLAYQQAKQFDSAVFDSKLAQMINLK